MKTLLRVPMSEQYAYIEAEFEGTAEEAIAEYHKLTAMAQNGVGLDTKVFNGVLDEFLKTGAISGDPGIIEQMSVEQSGIIQAIKRSNARNKK